MSGPTAAWERVGEALYRKVQLYTAILDDDLELENYVVTGAPYSGAIGKFLVCAIEDTVELIRLALYRQEEKVHVVKGNQAVKSSIDIYSHAGKLIRQINVRFAEVTE